MFKRFFVAIFLAILLSDRAIADGITLIPSLDQLHIVEALGPNQRDMCEKIQKAFVMQTGIETDYNVFRDNANHFISVAGERYAKKAEKFIDEDTVFDSKTVAIAIVAAYTIAITKSYTQNLGEPLFKGVRQSIIVGQDKIIAGINYSF